MELPITLLFIALTAVSFGIAALYTPRCRVALLLMLTLPVGAFAIVLGGPVNITSLLSDPWGQVLIQAGIVVLGFCLVRNILHLQV